MMKTCNNPNCSAENYDPNGIEGDRVDYCPDCEYFSCENCGSFFDMNRCAADRCIYCGGSGRVDCDDMPCDLEFCSGCGNPCRRLGELREENGREESRRTAFDG